MRRPVRNRLRPGVPSRCQQKQARRSAARCALLVARSGLGTINHTSLSLQALKAAGVPVLGVVMVGETNLSNREAIEHFGEVPVLAELPLFNELGAEALEEFVMPDRLARALASL